MILVVVAMLCLYKDSVYRVISKQNVFKLNQYSKRDYKLIRLNQTSITVAQHNDMHSIHMFLDNVFKARITNA